MGSNPTPSALTDPSQNEAKTRYLYDAVWNERRLELIEEWVTPDFVGHYSAYPELVRGVAGFRAMAGELIAGIPDLQMEIEETIASRERVVSRVTMKGTHNGPLVGFAPTGRSIEVGFIAIEHYGDDGRVVEEWAMTNDLEMSRQIGALPAPGSVGEKVAQRLFTLSARRSRRKARRA